MQILIRSKGIHFVQKSWVNKGKMTVFLNGGMFY